MKKIINEYQISYTSLFIKKFRTSNQLEYWQLKIIYHLIDLANYYIK